MKIKVSKIIIMLTTLLILFTLLKIQNFKKTVIEVNLENFMPFSKNNTLVKLETNFKIDNNLPTIEAASAFYPFSANIVQNIYDESNYTNEVLKMVSTDEAYTDIINGKTDIVIATSPSDEQKSKIEKSNIEIEFVELYLEPIVFFVNKNNTIENLNVSQIQEIYYSNSLNWKQFNGKNATIHTYQLEKNNGSQTAFESIVKNNNLNSNHHEINTMPKIIDKVAINKNGIGYAFYSYYTKMYSNTDVKLLNINNENPKSENYPLLFDVYLIYKTDNENENIKKIVDWIKTEEDKEFIKICKNYL